MNQGDRDLDELADMLGQVLSRIDAKANDLAREALKDPGHAAHELEEDTIELHNLVDDLVAKAIAGTEDERSSLNKTAQACMRELLQDLDYPLVTRQQFAANPDQVPCTPARLTKALQRALALAAGQAGHGGELIVATSNHQGRVRLSITCSGDGTASHDVADRTETLQEFVAELRGEIEVRSDSQGTLEMHLLFANAVSADR